MPGHRGGDASVGKIKFGLFDLLAGQLHLGPLGRGLAGLDDGLFLAGLGQLDFRAQPLDDGFDGLQAAAGSVGLGLGGPQLGFVGPALVFDAVEIGLGHGVLGAQLADAGVVELVLVELGFDLGGLLHGGVAFLDGLVQAALFAFELGPGPGDLGRGLGALERHAQFLGGQLAFGGGQIGPGLGQGHLVVRGVQHGQHVAGGHELVVLHRRFIDIAGHPGCDGMDAAVHEGVVGGHLAPGVEIIPQRQQGHGGHGQDQDAFFAVSRLAFGLVLGTEGEFHGASLVSGRPSSRASMRARMLRRVALSASVRSA